MNKCGDCLYFGMCSLYVDAKETFPEIDGGCHIFKRKDAFVEVVRCKDCKSWKYDAKKMAGLCKRHINYTAEWDFCSYGERKDNERKAD